MAVVLEVFYSLVLLGSIGSKPVSGEVQFNTSYGGQEVIGIVGSSREFAWTFTGDMKTADWGTKTAVGNDIDVILVSLTTSGPGSAVPPPQYAGRVNGTWDGKTSPGLVTFTLNSITKDDEDAYVCQITPISLLGLPAVDSFKLVVKDPARASLLERVIVEDVGDTATFTCNATGIPAPTITWMRRLQNNETVVVSSNSKYEITSGSGTSSLKIKSITLEDYGYYECNATGLGFDVAYGFLGVPHLNATKGPVRFSYTKGPLVTLDCPVIGFPQPQVTWTLPNGSVVPNRLVSTLSVILETDADFGNYTCNATSLDRTIPPLNIEIKDSVLPLESEVKKNGTPAVLNWKAVSNAEYYLVKMTGDSIEDDVGIASGNRDSIEIHFNTLVLKGNKKVKEVQITVQVLALSRDDIVSARGKRHPATIVVDKLNSYIQSGAIFSRKVAIEQIGSTRFVV